MNPYVQEIQSIVGVKPDGIAGPATVAAVRAAIKAPEPPGDKSGYYQQLMPVPPMPRDYGLAPCKVSTQIELWGHPRMGPPPIDCSDVTNGGLSARMVTESVGPFRVTGMDAAVASLRRVMALVQSGEPELYQLLGAAGMLCARAVRGGSNWSNHSWGTAVDIKIAGKLDTRGNSLCQRGLVELLPFFTSQGWYWGGFFSVEDAMHFEASDSLVRQWSAQENASRLKP